jgi:hypothetical protein
MLYQPLNNERLDALRYEGDPLADQVIVDLFERGDIQNVNELLKPLTRNDQIPVETFPEVLNHFLEESGKLPDWADYDLMVKGQKVSQRYVAYFAGLWAYASLPSCYAARDGVQVLSMSSYIGNSPAKRLAETGQMLLDVLVVGGFEPSGHAIRSIQKVRLIHAAVRYLIENSDRWDYKHGKPINQEDMLGTLFSFYLSPLESMEKLGVEFSDEALRAIMHLWAVVGYMSGVREEVIPDRIDDVIQLGAAIRERHYAPSPEGQDLTQRLIAYIQENNPPYMPKSIVPTMMRYFVGDETADMLAIPRGDWTRAAVPFLQTFSQMSVLMEYNNGIMKQMTERIGGNIINSIIHSAGTDIRKQLQLPAHLTDHSEQATRANG